MKDCQIEEIIIAILRAEKLKKYNVNLIDLCRANENAHSRILSCLFGYKKNNEYLFLKKFVQLLNKELGNGSHCLSGPVPQVLFGTGEPKIKDQWDNIDIYIELRGEAAIVIENKIQWARDQYAQIERYTDTAMNCIGSKEKVFVVYLTDDGRKWPEPYSLTSKAKEVLGYENEQNLGRFIPINYKMHILPLLMDFSKIIEIKNITLTTALNQYIDHLNGRYGYRDNDKEFNEAMVDKITRLLKLNEMEDEYDKLNAISDCQNKVWNYLEKLKENACPSEWNKVIDRVRDILDENSIKPLLAEKIWIWSNNVLVVENFLLISTQNSKGYVIDIFSKASKTIELIFFKRDYCHDKNKNTVFEEEIKQNGWFDVLSGENFEKDGNAGMRKSIELRGGSTYDETARNIGEDIISLLKVIKVEYDCRQKQALITM